MPTAIENMIEFAKQKISGAMAGSALPGAAIIDLGANAVKAVPKMGYGVIGAITGMEPPKTADYNWNNTKQIMTDQQNIARKEYGAEQGLKQNIREGLKGVGFTEPVAASPTASTVSPVTPTAPSTVTPTVASTPPSAPINAVSRPEGDPNFFRGGAKFEGNSLTSTGIGTGMSKEDLADWKARGDLQNSSYYDGKNPNDDKFTGMMKELMDVSGSSPSAETSNKIKSLRLGIQALAPMTSYGQFGVAGLQTDTTKRGQDITAETARREQDISTKIHGDKTLLDTFYKTGLLEQGKEELGIKKLQAEAKDLPGYLKLVTSMSPKIKTTDPVT